MGSRVGNEGVAHPSDEVKAGPERTEELVTIWAGDTSKTSADHNGAYQERAQAMTTTSASRATPLIGLWVRAMHLMTIPRAAAKTAVWLRKVFPMLPWRPLNWVTPRPVVERFGYGTSHGNAEGDLYRPSSPGTPALWSA
jgi:hypothetical protein